MDFLLLETRRLEPRGAKTVISSQDVTDVGLIPGSERSPGEGNSNPLQDSCLKNSMDRRAREAISPRDYKELDMTKHVCKKNVII